MSAVARETADDLMIRRLEKSVAMTCKHKDATVKEGWTRDTNEFYQNWYCEACDKSWTIWPEEGA